MCAAKMLCVPDWGGDELVIFTWGAASPEDLESRIDRIKKERGKAFVSAETNIRETLQFSMGTAVYPDDGNDFYSLMNKADKQMYQEKKMRKN